MMASLLLSSSKRGKNYHVFLSFRGTDVRNNFLGHLYNALDSKGINAYKDDEKLRKGEEITPALMEAIEGSHLAVVILSENYAESAFCLRELTRVMECKELGEIVVLPVFFKVEPREVRGQRESYGRAMSQHEARLGVGPDEVAKWRKALRSVGILSGWPIQDGDEAELVRSIVKEVLSQLDRPPLRVAKYPVGIDVRVEMVKSKLERQSKDISMVGIWGMGGVGKTTIAKAVYNSLSSCFVDRCFIENVRENSGISGGKIKLQQQFLSEVLREKDFPFFIADGGIGFIKDRLCCKKILLVLDDVDELEQLDSLVGRCDWFGRGSQIIITTRNRCVLTRLGIGQDEIFTAEALCHEEALELFCSHAFRTSQIEEIDEVLVNRVLGYADGLPLALVVLGSFLCGRSEQQWQSTIEGLEKTPDKTTNAVLKISFDGLADNEKEIFLDIACFLKGKGQEYVSQVLDNCGFNTILGLELLKERGLIQDTSQMHDLLQLMATDIVRRGNRDNPGMHSRLWLYDDVVAVLSGNQGTNAITGIKLMLPEPEELYVSPDAFRNMTGLRLLILHNVNLRGGDVYLPNNVRWLELHNCSIPKLGFDPGSKMLVTLDIRNSSITQLESQFANYRYLTSARFADCHSLVRIPDLSAALNLQTLDLSNCLRLTEVDQSVGRLEKLVTLNLRGCSGLIDFPDNLKSEALQTLDFTDCSQLKKFPEIVVRMQSLYEVHLKGSGIEELPASIENFIAVETFNLEDCKNLSSVPSSIYKLQTLETLVLKGCSRLKKFPNAIEDTTDPKMSYGCPKLRHLDLSSCSLTDAEFLENANCYPGIRSLKLSGNKISALRLHDRHYFDFYRFEGCQNMREISISGCRKFMEEFLFSPNPPEVFYGTGEVDAAFSGTTIPPWLKQHGFPHEIRRKEFSLSFRLTRWQLMDASTLAIGFVVGLIEGTSLEADVSCKIIVEVRGKGTYCYRKEFPGLKSDIMWMRLLPIGKMVDHFGISPIHVSVSLSSSTSCAKLKEFVYTILQRRNNYRATFRIIHEEDGNKSIEPDFWPAEDDWHYGEENDGEIVRNEDSTDSDIDSEACSEDCCDEDSPVSMVKRVRKIVAMMTSVAIQEMRKALGKILEIMVMIPNDSEEDQPESSTSGTEQKQDRRRVIQATATTHVRESVCSGCWMNGKSSCPEKSFLICYSSIFMFLISLCFDDTVILFIFPTL